MNKSKKAKISAEDFAAFDARFQHGVEVARAVDAKTAIPHAVTIRAYSLEDLVQVMSRKRMQLFKLAKSRRMSISELASAARRDPSAVSKDVAKLEAFGVVTVFTEPNAGHGVKKIVIPVAEKIDLVSTMP